MQSTSQSFIQIPIGLLQCPDLDASEKLIIAEALSFHRSGLTYFRSRKEIADIIGSSPRTVTRKLKHLHEDGFLIVKQQTAQSNTITIGLSTLKMVDPVAYKAVEKPTVLQAIPKKEPPQAPAPAVRLSKATDFIPKDVLSSLHYWPAQGRPMTADDAVTVLMLYGVEELTARNHCKELGLHDVPLPEQLNAVKKVGAELALTAKRSTMKGFRAFSYNDL